MPIELSDDEIAALIQESKPLPANYRERIQGKPKNGHKERDLYVKGASENEFQLIIRQSLGNPLDFSVILAFRSPHQNKLFRLRRYNGRSHEHTNRLEGDRFFDFHIHTATERYQDSGLREDAFAEPSSRFSDLQTAISAMVQDCGFELPYDPQQSLFDNGPSL